MLNEVAGKQKNILDIHSGSSRVELIQMLIPLGMQAMSEVLMEEVNILAGRYYERGFENQRWGSNPGSAYLGDQKVSVEVPRVRNKASKTFVSLRSYEQVSEFPCD